GTEPDALDVASSKTGNRGLTVKSAVEDLRPERDPALRVQRLGHVAVAGDNGTTGTTRVAVVIGPIEHARPHAVPIGTATPFRAVLTDVGRDVDARHARRQRTAIEVNAPDQSCLSGQ